MQPMIRAGRCLGLLSALALVLPQAAAAKQHNPGLLSPAELGMGLRLPPPPADGSPEQKRELAELHRLQDARTPQQRAEAKWDNRHKDGESFAPAFGSGFDLNNLPATATMLEEVRREEQIAVRLAKAHFQRKRPWMADPSLTPCAHEHDGMESYPSGHATMAYSMATVLAAAAPAKSKALMAQAEHYAELRVACGRHFPSDIRAGRTLGQEVGQALLTKPAFKAQVDAAAVELKALR